MSGVRLCYTLLLYLLLPAVLLRLAWRARRQRGYVRHVAERFGWYAGASAGPHIWIHAVSVGETRAADPLIRALRARDPGCRVLLTHMTPTGRDAGAALFGEGVVSAYLPYDYPGAMARFLGHFRPRAGILMETEIWPNLIQACRGRGVPLYLANARLSEKSFGRYRRFPRLARESFAGLAAVAAQGEEDARRLAALGAVNVHVMGNVKFDVTPPPAQLELGGRWRRDFGDRRPVFLAASTRDGEEDLLIEALAETDVPDLLTVIVPRHPQRFEEVERRLVARGLRVARRSRSTAISADTQVVLGDSMGELFAYYAACDVAFIGGSLVPLGGQNLIEACATGKPVLIGPSTYNFAEATQWAVASGAAVQVTDARAVAREAARLLRDPQAARRMGEAGFAFCAAHRGATDRILALIGLKND